MSDDYSTGDLEDIANRGLNILERIGRIQSQKNFPYNLATEFYTNYGDVIDDIAEGRKESPLNEEHFRLVSKYRALAQHHLKQIGSGEKMNYIVVDPDFLDPTVLMGMTPLSNEKGEFSYYWKINFALERILVEGKITLETFCITPRYPPGFEELYDKDAKSAAKTIIG